MINWYEIGQLKENDIIYGIKDKSPGRTYCKGNVYKIKECGRNGDTVYGFHTTILEREPGSTALRIGEEWYLSIYRDDMDKFDIVRKPVITELGKLINKIYLEEKALKESHKI